MTEKQIQASELRIGNLIALLDEIPLVVTRIAKDVVATQYPYGDMEVDLPITDFEPIPISPEWLERLGFDKDGEYAILKLDGYNTLKYDLKHPGMILVTTCEPDDYLETNTYLHHIDFVHQAQNFYHSFTGQELEIKEKV